MYRIYEPDGVINIFYKTIENFMIVSLQEFCIE